MNLPPAPEGYGGPSPRDRRFQHPYRWVIVAGILVAAIIAVGVLFWLLLPRPRGFFGDPYPIGGFFLVFLVIFLGFAAVRMAFWSSRRQRYREARWSGRYGPPGGFDPAIREARMRYARGEITREQFEQIVSGLRPRPPPP